jgi:hypothetical protein
MADLIDLSDPSFEPTDEQLVALAKRAFADVPAQRRAAMSRLRDQIAKASKDALAELDRRDHRFPAGT